jgi:hypothetical protein
MGRVRRRRSALPGVVDRVLDLQQLANPYGRESYL